MRILEREAITLAHAPMPREAALIAGGGVAVIVLNANTPVRRHTYRIAHELAHLWLHVDLEEQLVYHMDCDEADDPRETEAEAFATWMLGSAAIRRLLP